MFGIELISSRRRRQLEASESRLKLNFLRSLLRQLMDEVEDTRQIHMDSTSVDGKFIPEQDDRDELVRLDHLLLDGRIAMDHLNGLPEPTNSTT